jgi:hypothetical protein
LATLHHEQENQEFAQMEKNKNHSKWRCRSRSILSAALVVLLAFSAGSLQAQIDLSQKLKFNGDFRLRFESTTKQEPGATPDILDPRYREVVRFRAGLSSRINENINFGVRLATGSPDDPNTADVTLGNFVDDLAVSLDRVYLELKHQGLTLSGGKIANPFLRTDLVWDGDVNPQGVAASYAVTGSGKFTPKFTGMYAIIDEQTTNPDSYMWGGQVQFSMQPDPDWSLTLAGGVYDYTIKSLTNADAGDTRSNNLTTVSTTTASAVTTYLSDFNLLDAIAIIEYRGAGQRTPVRFSGNFVKNNGAAVDDDMGFMFDLFVGRASQRKDLRFRYGYAKLETDAVLAAFSNDNTTLASNYQQHTVTIDYVALDNTTLNLTWYLFRRNKVETGSGIDNDFISRLRLNAVVKF